MKNRKKLFSSLFLFISLSIAIFSSSCSDGYDDEIKKQTIYLNIEDKDAISLSIEKKDTVFVDGKFDLTLDTNIYSYDVRNEKYELHWGDEIFQYETYVTSDKTIKIRTTVKYKDSYEGKAYPITIIDKASGEVLATGPELYIKLIVK